MLLWIPGVEELESLANEWQVHHLMLSPHTLHCIEHELLQYQQFLLHKTSQVH